MRPKRKKERRTCDRLNTTQRVLVRQGKNLATACTSRQPLTASQSSSASHTLTYTGGCAPGAKTHIASCSRSSCTQHGEAEGVCGDHTELQLNAGKILASVHL